MMDSCCQPICRIFRPVYRIFSQCIFGFAMLFIIIGVALCIWGYIGEKIRAFQILGPSLIGSGLLVYVIGCVLCCKDYPVFAKKLQEKHRREKTDKILQFLSRPEVINYLRSEPKAYSEFKILSNKILNNHG